MKTTSFVDFSSCTTLLSLGECPTKWLLPLHSPPWNRKGFGLERANLHVLRCAVLHSELNKYVKLNDKAKKLYPRNSCRCDFYYPEIHQAIEYNGAFHDLQEENDFKRAAALEIMGYHSMILSFDTYGNLWALGEVAYNIARKHGKKRHHGKVAPTRGRLELHASLKRYYLGLDRTAPEWMKGDALMAQMPVVPDLLQ